MQSVHQGVSLGTLQSPRELRAAGRSPMKLSLLAIALLSAARALHVHYPAPAVRSSALTRRALLGGAAVAALIGPEQACAASLFDNVKSIENSNPPDQRNVQAEFSNAVRLTDAGAALCRIEFSISDSTPPEYMCNTSLRLPQPPCATPGGAWPERRGSPRRWIREYTPNAAPGYIKVLAATANKNTLSTLIPRGVVAVAALYSKRYGLLETSTITIGNCEAN